MSIDRATVERARARAVADPSILIQGSLALKKHADGFSTECKPNDPEATCFCTLGLIANEAGLDSDDYEQLGKDLGFGGRTHEINRVISLTDAYENADYKTKACFSSLTVAGLDGFDYLLEHLPAE